MMYSLLKKLFFTLDPETAHNVVKKIGQITPLSLWQKATRFEHKTLECKIGSKTLKSPIGLAAGFDKNAEMVPFLEALGFGFVELGSVTKFACEGNAKPRIFRLAEDESLINWMGLPNHGAEAFRLKMQATSTSMGLGINIAKTPDFAYAALQQTPLHGIEDFLETYRTTVSLGDYTVFNLSCPNTGEAKTFENPSLFLDFAKEVVRLNTELKDTKPVLIKISPDLEENALQKIIESAMKLGFDGFVVSNTTRARPDLKSKLSQEQQTRGGLSGKALKHLADDQLKRVFNIVKRDKILIASGGILSFSDLLDKLKNGAQFFQIYTGLIYQGPLFVNSLKRQLAKLCAEHGVTNYQELVEVIVT